MDWITYDCTLQTDRTDNGLPRYKIKINSRMQCSPVGSLLVINDNVGLMSGYRQREESELK